MIRNHLPGQFAFDDFVLNTAEATLMRRGERVPLAPKEFDLLEALVRRAGHLAQKEVLIEEVWRDTFVSDSSLLRTISVLRRHLGHHSIRTVPKRGYVFVPPVVLIEGRTEAENHAIASDMRSPNDTKKREESHSRESRAIASTARRGTGRKWATSHGRRSIALALIVLVVVSATAVWKPARFLDLRAVLGRGSFRDDVVAERIHREAARRLCNLAWSYRNEATTADLLDAIEIFRQGTRAYPEDPRTWAGLADSLALTLEQMDLDTDREGTIDEAELAAQRAVMLGPNFPEAHLAVGTVYWEAGNRQEADKEYQKALELNPNYEEAIYRRARLLAENNRLEEAKQQFDRALQMDPSALRIVANAADLYARLGLYDQGLNLLHRALEMNEDSALLNGNLGLVFVRMHHYPEAVAAFENARKGSGTLLPYGAPEAYCLARMGRERQARNILIKVLLEKREHRSGYDVAAMIYAGLNEKKKALRWLRQAIAAGEVTSIVIQSSPYFESLRCDPGFSELTAKYEHP